MSLVLLVSLLGMALIAVIGFVGRRRPAATLDEWTVGGRNFGAATTWFLQAGEVFTTFTFLGVAGIAFSSGAAATYAIPYLPLAFIGLYFLAPRVWELGNRNGYLTQADFYADRYQSQAFGKVVAIVGVVFVLPYLQLQITGLGLIVELVTGSASSGTLSMVVATVLTVAFVLWSGIRGLANTAYLKDGLMLLAMVVLIIAVPVHYAGGVGELFSTISDQRPELLTVGDGPQGRTWWLTGMLISAIGTMFLTVPHQWPPLLAARSGDTLRRNFAWLPIYQVVIIFPVIIGFVGVVALSPGTNSNGVLLTLAAGALPGWLTGVIAVAAASAAMVPAAGLCIAISTLIAHNLAPAMSDRARMGLNHAMVILAAGFALVLGIARPDLLANLLLLTFSGLAQLAPAFVAALGRRRLLSTVPAALGVVVGVGVVILLTFTEIDVRHVNVGIIGLVANIVTSVVAEAVARARGVQPVRDADDVVHPSTLEGAQR